MLSNKVYDILKWVTMVLLPALAVFYSVVAPIWGWPYVAEVTGTLAAVTVLLGSLLQLSNATYKAQNKE